MAVADPPTSWTGQPRIRGGTESMRLFLLTFSLIGLQFCWGTEQTYATPYLLALGLSKGGMSLVWIAGPLSGLIMQPIIGMISDKSTSKYGRRRPFMVGGTVAVAICLLVLGWAKEIVAWFVPGTGADVEERRRSATITVAIVDIYILDFVINIAQATCRALVVDALPVEKQQIGAAWVTRMVGLGHILVFGFGALDLNYWLPPVFGDTQFKKVCAFAAFMMVLTFSVNCWAVTERVLVSDGSKTTGTDQTLIGIIKQIYSRALYVPQRIQYICNVQFWAWIGWFPLMFYGSTWVGEIYLRHGLHGTPPTTDDALSQVGRVGSTALIIHSSIGFVTAIVLPWLVTSPGEDEKAQTFTPRPPKGLEGVAEKVPLNKPSLLNVWTFGCLMFSSCLFFAPLVKSVGFATFLMAVAGVPSAIAGLACTTLIGVEINRLSSTLPTMGARNGRTPLSRTPSSRRSSNDYELEEPLHLRHSSQSSVGATHSATGELSGIYLGILNIYTTLPQFVGTAISWVVFSILEPGKSPELAKDAHPDDVHPTEGLSGIGVCLFIGSLSSVMAAIATRKLKEH
ncbi:Putative MFS transporter superfamily [Septoria linicola]|uniref:MFS transporter superfamily n=1 Tax=Septoria linicola TaxID=215465 RepID=A0A9Q9EHY1_9PEZI|nr:putative MFS transporter superfamily [Septoria linicola]USW51450.1 Putative MFS transporter superfamily [Septoria linicola]